LLRPDECPEIGDIDAIVQEGLSIWRTLSERKDVSTLLASGRVMHEVPFSLQARRDNKPVILRGVIDCVVEREDGSVVIVEFKTGRPRSWHARQLDLYVEAENVDDLYQRFKDRVEVVEGLHDTFYGMREFIIRDLNRFWITFGQAL